MAKRDTLFTVAGITTHRGSDSNGNVSERTKVRYGTDLVRVFKMLNNPKKIEDKTLGICLSPVRVEFVELPQPMLKADALVYIATRSEFASAEDQAVIADEQAKREPKQPRVRKVAVSNKKAIPSLDSIKARIPVTTVVAETV